jgi:hypothetical protein
MFNSSDLKNVNNALYRVTNSRGEAEQWYVVRDLGTALGETARVYPKRGDVELFARQPFIRGVEQGFVEFNYRGWHQEVIRRRITSADVRWAAELLGGLTHSQWLDAFRAGGYDPAVAEQFIKSLLARIDEGKQTAF